jgi:hypothetical protein
MFVPQYTYQLTEHDRERPWIVVAQEHRSVDLDEGIDFFAWAREAWRASWYTVLLDPYQLSPPRRAED